MGCSIGLIHNLIYLFFEQIVSDSNQDFANYGLFYVDRPVHLLLFRQNWTSENGSLFLKVMYWVKYDFH